MTKGISKEMTNRRVQNELIFVRKSKHPSILALEISETLITEWIITVTPNSGSIFESLKLRFNFKEGYPFQPPQIQVLSPIFHPNVDTEGHTCLKLLSEWKSTYTSIDLIEEFLRLLDQPNTNTPMNAEACFLYLENKEEYQKRATSK